jgi:hypothetical protein
VHDHVIACSPAGMLTTVSRPLGPCRPLCVPVAWPPSRPALLAATSIRLRLSARVSAVGAAFSRANRAALDPDQVPTPRQGHVSDNRHIFLGLDITASQSFNRLPESPHRRPPPAAITARRACALRLCFTPPFVPSGRLRSQTTTSSSHLRPSSYPPHHLLP